MLQKFLLALLVLLDLHTLRSLILSRTGTVLGPLILGLVSSLGFAPYNLWPILLGAYVLLLCQISAQSSALRVFMVVLCYYTAFFALSCSWLQYTMGEYSGITVSLGGLIILVSALYLAGFYAVSLSLLFKFLSTRCLSVYLCCACPLAVIACDYVTGIGPLALPWLYFGYACQNGPFLSFAPLIGVRGMTLLFILTAALVAQGARRQFLFLPPAAVIFIAGVLLSDLEFVTPLPEHRATLVQGNIEQMVKWQGDAVNHSIHTYVELTSPLLGKTPLVVLPESAIPLYYDLAPDLFSNLNALAFANGTAIAIGIPRRSAPAAPYQAFNSLFILGQHADPQQVQIYDKRKLVPFGEYTPFKALLTPLSKLFAIPMSSFVAPTSPPELLVADGINFIPVICYEAVFPELLTDGLKEDSNALLMVSNDAWFGLTRGPEQLMAMSRLRTLELQKPALRASNNIHTALLDHRGRLIKELPCNQAGVLEISYTPTKGLTPYARYGNLILAVLCGLLLLGGVIGIVRRKDPKGEQLQKLVRP